MLFVLPVSLASKPRFAACVFSIQRRQRADAVPRGSVGQSGSAPQRPAQTRERQALASAPLCALQRLSCSRVLMRLPPEPEVPEPLTLPPLRCPLLMCATMASSSATSASCVRPADAVRVDVVEAVAGEASRAGVAAAVLVFLRAGASGLVLRTGLVCAAAIATAEAAGCACVATDDAAGDAAEGAAEGAGSAAFNAARGDVGGTSINTAPAVAGSLAAACCCATAALAAMSAGVAVAVATGAVATTGAA